MRSLLFFPSLLICLSWKLHRKGVTWLISLIHAIPHICHSFLFIPNQNSIARIWENSFDFRLITLYWFLFSFQGLGFSVLFGKMSSKGKVMNISSDELVFVYVLRKWCKLTFFAGGSPTCWKVDLSFPCGFSTLKKNPWTINKWAYLWTLSSVPLSSTFTITRKLYCHDASIITLGFEITKQISLPSSPHPPPHFVSILGLLHRHFWISFSIFTEKSLGIWGGTEENHIMLEGTTVWQHRTSWLMNRETLSLIDVCKLHSAKFCTFQCASHTHLLFVY